MLRYVSTSEPLLFQKKGLVGPIHIFGPTDLSNWLLLMGSAE